MDMRVSEVHVGASFETVVTDTFLVNNVRNWWPSSNMLAWCARGLAFNTSFLKMLSPSFMSAKLKTPYLRVSSALHHHSLQYYQLSGMYTNASTDSNQINHQPDATIFQFIILTFVYSSTCFGGCPAHHQELNDCSGSLWFTFVSWWQSCCVRGWAGRPARPLIQHNCHHDTKVKPEAATAVIELLMMSGTMPKTCWAVNKHQDNKLESCCIWLVIYLNCTMMHGFTNLKIKANMDISWIKYSQISYSSVGQPTTSSKQVKLML